MLKEELEKYGIEVGVTRTDQEKDLGLYDRGYKSRGYDLFLSLHSNAVGNSVNESVDYPACFCQVSGKSDKIGTLLSECVREVMQTRQPADHWSTKNSSGGDYYGVLRGATSAGTVGCIVEHSFHTNTRSTKWLMDDNNLRKLAVAEAEVIAEYLGVPKPTPPYVEECLKAFHEDQKKKVDNAKAMYRLYNPNSGEHFYTAADYEAETLINGWWKYEGIGWYAPSSSKTSVYRVYNPNAGEHHYTTSVAERNNLIKVGWQDEGIGWYSDDAKKISIYREYNPNAKVGTHNYTRNKAEHDNLIRLGWKDEGIGWYGVQ